MVIEGLSRSGECYSEAVKCLQTRYNKPHLIHQTHVKMILEAPQLTEGNGKELRRLHDVVQQHLRALKAMDCEPPGQFVTSILELKLDQNTMFEWQKHSQDSVPHYNDLLGFINLRAQASETLPARKGSSPSVANQPKRGSKPVTAYAASVSDGPNCQGILLNNVNPYTIVRCVKSLTTPYSIWTITPHKPQAHSLLHSLILMLNSLPPAQLSI